jgi:hypothetical protein
MNPDIDIVYHTLAHFNVPGDPSNLYSTDYAQPDSPGKTRSGGATNQVGFHAL